MKKKNIFKDDKGELGAKQSLDFYQDDKIISWGMIDYILNETRVESNGYVLYVIHRGSIRSKNELQILSRFRESASPIPSLFLQNIAQATPKTASHQDFDPNRVQPLEAHDSPVPGMPGGSRANLFGITYNPGLDPNHFLPNVSSYENVQDMDVDYLFDYFFGITEAGIGGPIEGDIGGPIDGGIGGMGGPIDGDRQAQMKDEQKAQVGQNDTKVQIYLFVC